VRAWGLFPCDQHGARRRDVAEWSWDEVVCMEDMEPLVFRALLCFVYTNMLLEVDKEEVDGLHRG
jgi:hypothetical protein